MALYQHLSDSKTWFDIVFLRAFVQLCYHDAHVHNPKISFKLIHCIFPDSKETVENNYFRWEENLSHLLCPVYVNNHFVLVEFDKEQKSVICYDGLYKSLDQVQSTISCVFKMCNLLPIDSSKDILPNEWTKNMLTMVLGKKIHHLVVLFVVTHFY